MLNLGVKRYSALAMGLVLCVTLSVIGRTSFAQAPAGQTPAAGQPAAGQPAAGQPSAGQAPTGPSESGISTTYREPKRDPFLDEKLLERNRPKAGQTPQLEIAALPWPSYEEREAEWKQKREDARKANQPEPAPSERYLIDELTVMGLFKKPEGQGVFLKPKTTANTMIFATVGQKFYNGSIRRIDSSKGAIECEEITRMSNKTTKNDKKVLRFTRGR